jgi:hypothetical protein
MIHPSDDDNFVEDNPLARPRRASSAAGGAWQQASEKAGLARQRAELFLRENPVPMILGALGVGLAIGLAIGFSSSSKEEEIKSPIGRVNWSFVSLPLLWPFFKSLKEKYEDSTEAVKGGVDRLREIDIARYAKPVRKRWKAWTH